MMEESETGFKRWDTVHEILDKIQEVGSLRIWILQVLTKTPKNRVEIMNSLQEHYIITCRVDYMQKLKKGERYSKEDFQEKLKNVHTRPSPGSVYPMLEKMVADDLIIKKDDGKYALTVKGRETIFELFGDSKNKEEKSKDIKSLLKGINRCIIYLEDVQKEDLLPYEDLIVELNRRFRKVYTHYYE